MHVTAAEGFRIHLLTGRRLHQGRPAEKYRALVAHDDRLIAHRWNVGAACGAAAHDQRDLRDAARGELCLVVEDPPEVVAVREHFILQRQKGAARVDEVQTGQRVLERDRLRAQVLLHRERKVGPAFDGRIVGDDDARTAMDAADTGDEPRGRHLGAIHPVGGEAGELEKRASRIEEGLYAFARQQLAAGSVLAAGFLRSAAACARDFRGELARELRHMRMVGAEALAAGIDLRGKRGHAGSA